MSGERMYAVKFLTEGGRSPYALYLWPLPTYDESTGEWTPGEWVGVGSEAPSVDSVNGCATQNVYAAPADILLLWADERAYVIELDGATVGTTKIGAARGRLLRPIEGWNKKTVTDWALWAANRAVFRHVYDAAEKAGDAKGLALLDMATSYVATPADAQEMANTLLIEIAERAKLNASACGEAKRWTTGVWTCYRSAAWNAARAMMLYARMTEALDDDSWALDAATLGQYVVSAGAQVGVQDDVHLNAVLAVMTGLACALGRAQSRERSLP